MKCAAFSVIPSKNDRPFFAEDEFLEICCYYILSRILSGLSVDFGHGAIAEFVNTPHFQYSGNAYFRAW